MRFLHYDDLADIAHVAMLATDGEIVAVMTRVEYDALQIGAEVWQ
jgi:hypothetical protein